MTKTFFLITLLACNFCFANATSLGGIATNTFGNFDVKKADPVQLTAHEKYCLSFDANGDGELNQIEKNEYKKARKIQLVRRFDLDNDGVLNGQEKLDAKTILTSQLKRNSNNYSLSYCAQ